jgi:hypothetical protein
VREAVFSGPLKLTILSQLPYRYSSAFSKKNSKISNTTNMSYHKLWYKTAYVFVSLCIWNREIYLFLILYVFAAFSLRMSSRISIDSYLSLLIIVYERTCMICKVLNFLTIKIIPTVKIRLYKYVNYRCLNLKVPCFFQENKVVMSNGGMKKVK